VCGRALSCWKISLRRFIADSLCGVKTSSLYRTALRLPWICIRWVFRRRIWDSQSSHFFRNITFVDDLDRRVRSCQPTPKTIQELQQALEQEWGRILQDRIRRLIESIPRSDLNGQGSTVTFWLARKSTVARTVCGRALSCWKISLRRFIADSLCGDFNVINVDILISVNVWTTSVSNFRVM
jgi:hypothetical protein